MASRASLMVTPFRFRAVTSRPRGKCRSIFLMGGSVSMVLRIAGSATVLGEVFIFLRWDSVWLRKMRFGAAYHPVCCVSGWILILVPSFSKADVSSVRLRKDPQLYSPRSAMFMTPGALEVVLRFLPSSRPATAESTFLRSDVSADIVRRWMRSFNEELLMGSDLSRCQQQATAGTGLKSK
jgi:hypothetical protein